MPEDHAPPVVAVVVASDSGPWLEACLASLAAQDYSNLTTIVVDAGSDQSLAPRVAAVAPNFYFSRLEENHGFGPSANSVRPLVEGAGHFLFCHDDVILEPDAVRRMTEEAYRENAGIVGPKLVDEDEPDRLLGLGLDMDRFGAPVRRVEWREFDQAQHDEAREVFAVPGGCMLVRADLFEAIDGFDPEISMFGEDIDLAWRARIAGARVFVTPLASVRHLEATAARRRPLPEARALQWRHELRAVLKNYSPARRVWTVAQLAVLSVIEIAYFSLVGRRRRAREVIDAWRWNLSRSRDLKAARAVVARTRRLPDRLVLRLATRSSFRFLRAARRRSEASLRRIGRAGIEEIGEHRRAPVTAAALVTALVLVFGSRLLLVGHLPVIGGYLPIPSPTTLLASYLGGSAGPGNGPVGPVSPAYAILGLAGIVTGGAMGVVLKAAMVIAVLAGAFGAARLVRPFGGSLVRFSAALSYLFMALAWDDLARGDLPALAVYGAMPWIVGRLARAAGVAPYRPGGPAAVVSRESLREAVGLGVLVAVACAFAPAALLAVTAAAAGMALVALGLGEKRAALRLSVVTSGSVVVAFVLCFPWSLTFLQHGATFAAFAGVGASGHGVVNPAALARFDLGPIGHGVLSYGLVLAAGYVLVVGGAERFAWAARFWGAALVVAAVTWLAAEGWLGHGGGASRVLIVPAAVCLAAAVGLGVASIEGEVSTARFGWRHTASIAFVLVGVVGLLPVFGEAGGGRWTLPENGFDAVLSGVSGGHGAAAGRYLWLGAPLAVPAAGWQLRPGFELALTTSLLPDATALAPSANPGRARILAAAVGDAELGRTVELGRLIAKEGVAAIVVPTSFGPELAALQETTPAPAPRGLLAALANQVDLRALPSEGATFVYANTAFSPPRRGGLPVPRGSTPAPLRSLGVAAALAAWLAAGLMWRAGRVRRPRAGRAHVRAARPTPPARRELPELVGAGGRP